MVEHRGVDAALFRGRYARKATAAVVVVSAVTVVFRHWLGWLLTITDSVHRSAWLQAEVPAAIRDRLVDGSGMLPWLSRFSVSFYVAAIFVFILMLWILLSIDRFAPNCPSPIAGTLRWVAEGTFSLYLLHLPMLLLISCLVPRPLRHPYLWAFWW